MIVLKPLHLANFLRLSSPVIYYILSFFFENSSFVINVEILNKIEILLAHIFPSRANPANVKPDPTPNPTLPIKTSETIIILSFCLDSYTFPYIIHYHFYVFSKKTHDHVLLFYILIL